MTPRLLRSRRLALQTVFPLVALFSGVGLARPTSVDDAAVPQKLSPAAVSAERVAVHVSPPKVKGDGGILIDERDLKLHLHRQHLLDREAYARLHDDLFLHAMGTQLYTTWNARITLKAVNWYGFEYSPFVPGGLDHARLDSIMAMLHRLGFNAIRLTFANATVEANPVVIDGLQANPELRGLHSLDILQRILQRAHRFGLRVLLCNNRSEAGMGPELKTGLWYTDQYPESAWRADWLYLVKRFQGESAFIGADLRNEPHLTGTNVYDVNAYFQHGPLWGAYQGNYYHDRDWRWAAETLGNALLKVNPRLLIVVEGVQLYLDPDRNRLFGGLWGSNLMGVQYDPVVLSHPSQLVYSVHEYGPKMWPGHWFSPATTFSSLSRRWWHHWGYLLNAPKFMQAPIFVGEFGTCDDWHSCIDDPHKPWSQGFWFSSFIRYMKAHPQVGWAYWSLNPEGPFYRGENNFYSLVTRDWRQYHPMVTKGLAPLLEEPNG